MEKVTIIDGLNGVIIGTAKRECVEGWRRYNNLRGYYSDGHTFSATPWNIRNYNQDLDGIDIYSLKPVAGVEIFF